MAVKFANLASTTLSSAITNSATSIAVADASLFPTLGSGDYFYATIGEGSGSEIVKVTAISSNTLTVTRAQDGTTASAFSSGETIALRVVAAALDDIASQAQSAADTESVSISGDTMTGTLTAPTINVNGKLSVEHDGSTTGDLLSLFSNRFDGTTMYGWGVNNGTLYHKAATRHQFYTATNYDNSSYDVQFDGQNFIIRTGDLMMGGNTFVDSSRNITAGTISSGAITSTGSSSFGDVAIGGAADSNYDLKVYGLARFQGAANFVDATNPIQVGGTTVIDSSRNLTNIVNFTNTHLITNRRTSAFSPDDSSAGLRLEYSGGDAANEIGSGIVFAQRWYNQSTNNVRTGGIAGYKGAGSGAFGGGLKFYTQPQSGSAMNVVLTLDKDKTATFTGIAKGMTHLELLNNGGSDGTATSPRLYSPASGTLAISANGGERGRFNSTGLTVTGEIYATNSSNNLVIGNSAAGNIYLGGGNNNTSNIYLQTGSSTAVSINSSNQSTFHGDVVVQGGLTVQGTTTTIDTTNLNVEDNNITLNYSTGDSSATANGAGITIQDAVNSTTDASMTWNAANDLFTFSHAATFGYNTIDPDSFANTSGGFGNINDGNGWGARGLFIHGGGTGDAAAIGHNGNRLYFGIQDGSTANSMATWLDVQPNKQTTFSAQLNVTGHGNSSQWNTAYGWGNHATAGYNNASNLSSGTLPSARLSGTYSEALNFSSDSLQLKGHMYFNEHSTGRHYIHFKTANSTNRIDWRIQTNNINSIIHSWTESLATFKTPMSIVVGGSHNNTDANNRFVIDTSGHGYIKFVSPDGYDQGFHFYNTTDNSNVGRVAYKHNSTGDLLYFRVGTGGGNGQFLMNASGRFSASSLLAGNIDSNINGNNTSGGNIVLGATGNNASKWFSISGRQYDSGTETEGYSLITGSVGSGVNNVYIGGGIDEQNAATVIYFKAASNTSTRNGTEIARINTDGLDIRNNVLRMTGTTVIDASRNITAGTISSGNITSGAISSTGNTHYLGGIKIKARANGENYIAFSGTTGDQPTAYNHTYIGEHIYGGTEQSELLLAKFNDVETSSAGSDRIRLQANNIVFDVWSSVITPSNNDDLSTAAGLGSPSTAMMIKESGQVLVGKTSTDDTIAGTNFEASASEAYAFTHGASGGWAMMINRQTSDGSFITFRKANAEVGKIVHESGTSRLTMGTGNTGLSFIDSGQDRIIPRLSGGGNANDAIDLGDGASQWRELYLSRGLRINSQTVINDQRHLQNIQKFDTNLIPRSFALPQTGGSTGTQWIYLGKVASIAQHGASVVLRVHGNTGYNAGDSQNVEAILRFKTSNGSSTNAANTSFYGDAQLYNYGQASVLRSAKIKQVSTTEFEFYIAAGQFTGDNSFYTVEHRGGIWTNGGTYSGTAPSGTVLDVSSRTIFTSGFNQNSDLLLGTGDLTATEVRSTGAMRAEGGLTVRNGNTNAALHLHTGDDFCGIGFNRNVGDGSIYDSNINAFQMHIQNNVLEIETYNGAGTTQADNAWRLDTAGNMTAKGTLTTENKLVVDRSSASGTEPTAMIHQGGTNSYGFIAAHDQYHGIILRGFPNQQTGYGVTPGNYMSFAEFGGDFRFYTKSTSTLSLDAQILGGVFDGEGVKVNGTLVIDVNKRLLVSDGSASAPYMTFAADTNTGFYRPAADNIGFAVGGVARAFMSGTQFNMTGNGVFSGYVSSGSHVASTTDLISNQDIQMNRSGVSPAITVHNHPAFRLVTSIGTGTSRTSSVGVNSSGVFYTNTGFAVNSTTVIDSSRVGSFANGTTFGSIEADGAALGNQEAGIVFQPNSAYRCVHPVSMTATAHTNDISLGWSNNKWKHLFLAGNVYCDSAIEVTANEGREIKTYMPSSYTTGDIVSGHEYGWYNDYWRVGMTRSGDANGDDFAFTFNNVEKASLSKNGDFVAQTGQFKKSFGANTSIPNVVLELFAETTSTITTGGGTAIKFKGRSSGGNIANYDQAMIASVGQATNNAHGLDFYYKPDGSTALTKGLSLSSIGEVVVQNQLVGNGGINISAAGGSNIFYASTNDSRVLKLRDRSSNNGNIVQFQLNNGTNIWELVGRDGSFYVYKNTGTGSGYKWQIDSNGYHVFTGGITFSNGVLFNSEVTLGTNTSTTNAGRLRLEGTFANTGAASHPRLTFNDDNFGIGAGGFATSGQNDDLYLWAYNGAGRKIRFCATTAGNQDVTSGSWVTNATMDHEGNFDLARGDLTVPNGNLTLGSNGQTPKLTMMYTTGASAGWDTRIHIGRSDDLPNGAGFPTATPNHGYGIQFQANSDGAFFGIERYASGEYRPVINWGDDTSDSPFRIAFNNGTRFQMDSSGNFTANGNVTAYSDAKLKDNVEEITDALAKVSKIRGVTYTRNDQKDTETRHMGVIAQEVEAAGVSEVVEYDAENDIKTVAYGNMVGLLIEAIKEQSAQIESLNKRIEELENGNN